MKYAQGSLGRVFLLTFEDQDDLLAEIKKLAKKENVRAATISLLGGMRSSGIVAGPKEAVIPPDPMWLEYNDTREVVGFGTLFRQADEPVVHLHAAAGRGTETFTGCMRRNSTVFLVIEAVVTELTGIEASKTIDQRTGLAMLDLPKAIKA